jgi:hypothetical protein
MLDEWLVEMEVEVEAKIETIGMEQGRAGRPK